MPPEGGRRPTAVAWPRGFLGEIQKGGGRHHVVEDGADPSWVRHHKHPQQVEEDHVAVTIL